MSGGLPPLPLYAFMAWTGTISPLTFTWHNADVKPPPPPPRRIPFVGERQQTSQLTEPSVVTEFSLGLNQLLRINCNATRGAIL